MMKNLKNLVVFGSNIQNSHREMAEKVGLKIISLQEVYEVGSECQDKSYFEPTPDCTYMLSYTSGTTGDPKGVKLSHKMILGSAFTVTLR
jgi:long-subunit acyl-CoA synthetase (AMP-forming)